MIPFWAKPKPMHFLASMAKFADIEQIEARLHQMFPSAHPVVTSSGRTALAIALASLSLGRIDRVAAYDFASHCVLDAISRIAMPVAADAQSVTARVVYHQWGFVQTIPAPPAAFIEDAIDTLCEPGCTLFPTGGMFEIWSLSKILGTLTGGVLWCRDEASADQAKGIRDARPTAPEQVVLRLLAGHVTAAHHYWHGRETLCGPLPRFAAGEIVRRLEHWHELCAHRRQRLKQLAHWLEGIEGRHPGRLAHALPLPLDKFPEVFRRQFEFPSRVFADHKPVFPLPLHAQVPDAAIMHAANLTP